MSEMFSAKVTGLGSLSAKFRALEKAVQSEVLETALVSGALLVQNEWKANAPVLTGNYRRSIHIGGHTDKAGDFQGEDMGRQDGGQNGASVIIGTSITDPPYPLFLENGTSRMTARPSAGPALRSKKAAAIKEIGDAFKEIVEKIA